MTAEGLDGKRGSAIADESPTATAILDLCDRVLGEIGRRRHLFAWLRPPGSGTEDWLVVDAYYPGNRMVVICREEPAADDHLYGELVPGHGLRLLAVAPSALGDDRSRAVTLLRGMIAELGPAPPRPVEPALPAAGSTRDGAMARFAASLAQASAPPIAERRPVGPAQAAAVERATRLAEAHKLAADLPLRPPAAPGPSRRPSVPRARSMGGRPRARRRQAGRRPATGTVGLLVGLALVVAVCAEVYAGVGKLALDSDHWLLAFGLALDVCARALGTIAAERARAPGWSWGCVLGGSPVVAAFALFQAEGPVAVDPAPLAGLLSVLATLAVAAAVLTG